MEIIFHKIAILSVFFDQIITALMSIRDCIKKKKSYRAQTLESNILLFILSFRCSIFLLHVNNWIPK